MPSADRSSQALVVGVSQYRHLGKLRKTQDAQGMREVLASPDYCAFPPERIRLLEDNEATRDNIVIALKEMCQSAKEAGSRTFFYFTGHGGQASDGSSYILPVDARKGEYPSTAISARDLSLFLDQCGGELTVVLDCCRAASMTSPDANPDQALPGALDQQDIELGAFTDSLRSAIRSREVAEEHPTTRVLFAACRATGQAYTSPGAPYSIFTGHMLACLRGADSEATGGANVTVEKLFAYIEKRVRLDSGDTQRPLFIAETSSFYALTDYPRAMRPNVEFENDVFISYDHDDGDLDAWVKNFFRLELVSNGISVWDYDDLGGNPLDVGDVIAKSRYVIVIFTQTYLKHRLQEASATLAALEAIEAGTRRFIYILREQVVVPRKYKYFVGLDMTPRREMQFRKNMDRLIKRLKKQPHEL